MKKRKILLSLLCLIALLFVGCSGNKPTPVETAEKTTETKQTDTETTVKPIRIVKEGQSDYVIVYPENASTEVVMAARSLAKMFKEYTGATLQVVDDYLASGATPAEKEILVGATNREESQEISASLVAGEYTVRLAGKKLVICGYNDNGTVKAEDYFVEKILKKASGLKSGVTDGTFIFREKNNFTQAGKYNIRSFTINGISLNSYKIVIPDNCTLLEDYLAKLILRHVAIYTGYNLQIVKDSDGTPEYEIRVGKTARTTAELPTGKATVTVGEKDMQILWSSGFGFISAYNLLTDTVMSNLQSTIELKTGDAWELNESVETNVEKTADLRIMYHNVWGYINADGSNPISIRPSVALSIYKTYAPDILCLEECSTAYRSGGQALMTWLSENYIEVCDGGQGIGNPIFYSKTMFEAVESGYSQARSGDKGTTWVVLKRKSDGKIFAVTNSHFAANTNAGDNATLGNTYRVADAGTVVSVVESIKEKYGKITVISGGDFNAKQGSDPYTTLTDGGLKNIRSIAETCTQYSPYYTAFEYNSTYDMYGLQTALSGKSANAIDHMMYFGAEPTVKTYDVVNYGLALTASDHAPHFADFNLSDVKTFGAGNSQNLETLDFDQLFN